ncbi:MAG: signal peptidase II [Thiotrichales bacterium]
MLKWLWLTALVIVLDQATKIAADNWINIHQSIPVIPGFFDLTLAYNKGAAFSFLSDAGGWQRWLFTGLALVISVVLVIWIKRLPTQERLLAASLALILGGALGNLIDRLFYGHVIDFIHWYYKGFSWPAFNLADSAITLGATLMIIHTLFFADKHHSSGDSEHV